MEALPPLWCRGLPYCGDRPLEPGEEVSLKRRLRRLTWELGVGVLAFPFCLVPMLLLALALDQQLDEQAWGGQVVVAVLALLGIGLPIVVMLWLRGSYVARRDLRFDLRAGRVFLFASSATHTAPQAVVENQSLEVLADSRWLLRCDGDAVAGFETVEIYEAAAPPAAAPRYAVPQAWQQGLGEGLSVERRRLSPAELAELTAHIARLKRPSFSLIFMAGLLGVAFLTAVSMGIELARQPLPQLLSGLIWSFGLLLNLWFYGRDLRLARRLEIDRGNEWVVIYEEEGNQHHQRAAVEVLPASAAVWAEDGRPTPWRRRERPRKPGG